MAPGEPYMSDHYYLMAKLVYRLTSSRTPVDPNPDPLTGVRNEAFTRLHWFSILGGKSITTPCEERINDNFIMKQYNPEQEKRSQFIKYGIVVGVAGVSVS